MNANIQTAYTTPGHPGAFSAPGNLYRLNNGNISLRNIEHTLQGIKSYNLHKFYKRPKPFNPYYIYGKREQFQIDLVDIKELKKGNDMIAFLLVCIDAGSRKLWVKPLKRKTAKACTDALKEILESLDRYPAVCLFDDGTEFRGGMRNMLLGKGIRMQLAKSDIKCGIVERVNKSLQSLLYKYMTQNNTDRYIDVLDEIVETYNRRPHRGINFMTPNAADLDENQTKLREVQISRFSKLKRKEPRYRVGDIVRIKSFAYFPSQVRRSYVRQFKDEYYKIKSVHTRMPIPMYTLEDMDKSEVIEGKFYENELSLLRGDIYEIEKVIKQKGRAPNKQYYVKWKHFGPRWNQWIHQSDFTHNI